MSRVLSEIHTAPHVVTQVVDASDSTVIAKRAAMASATGTAVEYYEFSIYGYMATIIAPLFFPSGNATAALLATLAVFGIAFVVRPIGGVLLGRLADASADATCCSARS